MKSVAAWVALGLVVCFASEAHAQSAAEIAARGQLLQNAQEARARGDHAVALDLATRASEILATASVLRFMAEEQVALVHLADALGNAQRCLRQAASEPPSHNLEQVMAGCQELATSLATRVAFVRVNVPMPAPEGLRVVVAGSVLSPALYNVDAVVTPGDVDIEARAPGYSRFRTRGHVEATGHTSVTLRMQQILVAQAITAPPPAPSSGARRLHQILGGVGIGVGVVLAGSAVVSEVVAQSQYSSLRNTCASSSGCPSNTAGTMSSVSALDTWGTAGLYAGAGVALVGLAVLVGSTVFEHGEAQRVQAWVDPVHGAAGAVVTF